MTEANSKNFLGFQPEVLDEPIYRVFPLGRLIQCFAEKRITLVKPSAWNDPFENFLLNCPFDYNGETLSLKEMSEKVVGQCWTSLHESDAMWRIYSADKCGVRVKSSPRRMLNALWESCEEHPQLNCFIGAVEYLPAKALISKLEKIRIMTPDGSGMAKSLLYKRMEFEHEHEVRIILTDAIGKTYNIPIDVNQIFDDLLFDPRLNDDIFSGFEHAFKRMGFKGDIKKSRLYKLTTYPVMRLR